MSNRARRFPSRTPKPSQKSFEESWISRLYFATFPVSTLGNWIPRVLSQWYCSGHGCGFDQIVIENAKGKNTSMPGSFIAELRAHAFCKSFQLGAGVETFHIIS